MNVINFEYAMGQVMSQERQEQIRHMMMDQLTTIFSAEGQRYHTARQRTAQWDSEQARTQATES